MLRFISQNGYDIEINRGELAIKNTPSLYAKGYLFILKGTSLAAFLVGLS